MFSLKGEDRGKPGVLAVRALKTNKQTNKEAEKYGYYQNNPILTQARLRNLGFLT